LLDLFKSALEARAQQGELSMSKSKLVALAGPLTILVGALWLASAIGDFIFRTVLSGEDAFLGLVAIPFLLSFIPLPFALIGTRLRFHPSASTLGRLGLMLGTVGAAGVLIFLLASMLFGGGAPETGQLSWVNYTAVAGVLNIRIGYLLFGVDALRLKLLPRWNLLPLLVGLTIVLSLPLEWFGVPAILPTEWANPFLHFALTGACWVLLGLAMMNYGREPQPTAVV
jgi:hypothetical protein